MNRRQQLCPCESGKPFFECHGAESEEIPMVVRPLIIHMVKTPDGRVYKTIGTHPHQTEQEALKSKLWVQKGQPKAR